MLIGTIPYALFHLTAILPALVYIIQTMNFLDEEHLSRENLNVFVGREWLFRSGSVYCEFFGKELEVNEKRQDCK